MNIVDGSDNEEYLRGYWAGVVGGKIPADDVITVVANSKVVDGEVMINRTAHRILARHSRTCRGHRDVPGGRDGLV